MEEKIYYFHTDFETKYWIGGYRVSLAFKATEFGLKYGMAICNPSDNFSRKKGRELALNRLDRNFGFIVSTKIDKLKNRYPNIDDLVIYMGLNMRDAVENKINKFKTAIAEFEKGIDTPTQ